MVQLRHLCARAAAGKQRSNDSTCLFAPMLGADSLGCSEARNQAVPER
jgi:hypothetical protein